MSSLPEAAFYDDVSDVSSNYDEENKLAEQSESEEGDSQSSTLFEDENVTDDFKRIITRIIFPDERIYNKHIETLEEEEAIIKNEYLRTKLSYQLSEKNEKVAFISSVECEENLAEADKTFLLDRPDYSKTVNEVNELMEELSLLTRQNHEIMKNAKYKCNLITAEMTDLKRRIGKFIPSPVIDCQ